MRSLNTMSGRLGTLLNVGSFVTKSGQPRSRAVAAWIASGVLRLVVARSRAACSKTACVIGISATSGVREGTVR